MSVRVRVSTLTEQDWLQVDSAARGCVSGTLGEWPALQAVFSKLGLVCYPNLHSSVVKDMCRLIMSIEDDECPA